MTEEEKQEAYNGFATAVNLSPGELKQWLDTEQSKSVGDSDGGEESTGHKSGRRIVEIKRRAKAQLTDEDYHHMRKVVGYVHRHLAQRPAGDITETRWRYSLMNWGHDPTR